jgi:hypothetical protein
MGLTISGQTASLFGTCELALQFLQMTREQPQFGSEIRIAFRFGAV